jgi:CHAT domain-containing protein
LSLLFILSLLLGLSLGQVSATARFGSAAQRGNAVQLMQQGVEAYQRGDLAAAITAWQTALTHYQAEGNLQQTATALENLARAQQAMGQTAAELQLWQQAESAYRIAADDLHTGRMRTEQAQTYSRLGQYAKAIDLLCGEPLGGELLTCRSDSALGIAQALPSQDLPGELTALGSLGDAYRLRGKAELAIRYLEQGLTLALALQEPSYLISIQNSLGNAYFSLAQLNYRRALSARQIEELQEAQAFEAQAQGWDKQALEKFQASQALAQAQGDSTAELRARVSSLPIYYRSDWQGSNQRSDQQGEVELQQVIALLNRTPDSTAKVYAAIDLSRLLQSGGSLSFSRTCTRSAILPQAAELLDQATTTAQQLDDGRAESFALGELGHLYECQSDFPQALALTQQAQMAADQDLQARDSLYLWQWQTGRILKASQQPKAAIQSYEAALATLDSLRQDILTTSRDVQFDFRESVEPIYRELVELTLQQEQPSVLRPAPENLAKNAAQDNVSLALGTLDSLKLAELQNYFGNDCVLTALNRGETVTTPQTAILSTAILADRVAVILNLTQQQGGSQQSFQQFEWIQDRSGHYVNQADIIETVNAYREGLERIRDAVPGAPLGGYDPALAAQLYDWLIRPFEPLLQQNQIKTLVFVQDGIFRSVPMSALYDGSRFLIQNYAVAVTPSLNLTDLTASPNQRLRALAVGLTQQTVVNDTAFNSLDHVQSELDAVQKALPRSLELKDEAFTLARFERALIADPYPIIHIATHGKFSAESENAFLVTGDNLKESKPKLTLNVLDDLIRARSGRSPVELLVLSACQTATGDDRAALGLAGIAAQAGAKRVLASLWSINDQATTALIQQFYQGLLRADMTQTQALQAAQNRLIDSENTAHPGYWSAFVLIGNWR